MQYKKQQDVIEEYFDQNGITNHIESHYFHKLGNKIINSEASELKTVFPIIRPYGQGEWKMAFSLVHSFLAKNCMELTCESIKSFMPTAQPVPAEAACQRIGISNISDPILSLIHDQRVRKVLDPSTLDYDIDSSFYDTK